MGTVCLYPLSGLLEMLRAFCEDQLSGAGARGLLQRFAYSYLCCSPLGKTATARGTREAGPGGGRVQ